MKKLLVILGPTATGKTDLGLYLAKKFNGELVACDSRQVYKGLDIGTGKLPKGNVRVVKGERYWEMDGIKVWMYDVADPQIRYTVADYVKDATLLISDAIRQNKLPIIVGGTGLYLKALLEGLPNLTIPIDPRLRERLESLSKQALQQKLKELSLKRWEELNHSDRENPRRLLRSIELLTMYPYRKTTQISKYRLASQNKTYDILKIGLTAPRPVIYKKVDSRVLARAKLGMVEEAKVCQEGLGLQRMRELGLEYGVLADYFEGKITTKEKLWKVMKNKIHAYVRRQETWFKKEGNVYWFDVTEKEYLEKVEKRVFLWYYSN